MADQNIEYSLPQNAYANFDAVSLKQFIIEQLNKNSTFTDQNYEGSNMSSLIEILAYYTHVLMFYLNQTSSESSFSQATIYENMNRIVKLIQYKPTGKQTSLVSINCVADSDLSPGNYLIRKYSYFLVDNIQYTIIDDVSFDKTTSEEESIDSINDNVILYQGTIEEYPIYIGEGTDYETISIVVDNLVSTNDTRFISQGTISVYVKEIEDGIWKEYQETDSLFLSEAGSRVYDLRLNENGHYEVKFGNDIFGRKLKASDEVAIYYILSNGDRGQISKNAINGNKLFLFNSNQFNDIYPDVATNIGTIINLSNNNLLLFSNPNNSTLIQQAETVEEIRNNVPLLVSNQLRLVTEGDYEAFLKKNVPNILNSVKVVSNKAFIEEYIDYFYRICVDPNKVNRVILNQVNFADSCDFNNINVFCVPTFSLRDDEQYPEFLSNNFKNLIIDITKDKKMMSNEVVPRDPIYVALDLGYSNLDVSKNIYNDTKLVIVRNNSKTNKETIKKKVKDIITEFFNPLKNDLGQKIDLSDLTTQILSLEFVKGLRTTNTKENTSFQGISFVAWNPVFEGVDETLVTQTTTLPYFKFPYLYRPNGLVSKIEIVDE